MKCLLQSANLFQTQMSMFNQVENNELDLLTLLDRPFVAQVAPSLSSLST